MSADIKNFGLDESFISDSSNAPGISIYYNAQLVGVSGITGNKLYDYVDDTTSITQVYPISFGTSAPPPSGTNLFYMGSNQPTDVRFYDANGSEKTITAIYLGSTLVWQQ
jgi:hypothetical protein